MNDPLSIYSTTQQYLARYPADKSRLAPFLDFLENTDPTQTATRSNPVGHVTTSGFIVSEKGDALLLIYHLKLQRFLQPGGHFENDPSLLASALREIQEEVGLSEDAIELYQPDECPIDIDPHRIPEDVRKNLPEHWHFDFRYLFRVVGGDALTCQIEEVERPEWCTWESERVTELLPAEVIRKIRDVIAVSAN